MVKILTKLLWTLCWALVALVLFFQLKAAAEHLAPLGYPVAKARSDASDIYAEFSQNPIHQEPIKKVQQLAAEHGRVRGFIVENVYNARQAGNTTVKIIVTRESIFLERIVFDEDGRVIEMSQSPHQPTED